MTKPQRIKLAVAVGAAAGLFVLGLFWCGGFDFDHRGDVAVACLMFTTISTLGAGAMAYATTEPNL